MKIRFNNKNIEIKKLKKLSFFGKFKGLMFSRRENANAMLFEMRKPCKRAIHSLFVFFPFLAVWLDNKNIVEMKIIKPFTFYASPSKKFSRLIEIPINNRYKKIIELLYPKPHLFL